MKERMWKYVFLGCAVAWIVAVFVLGLDDRSHLFDHHIMTMILPLGGMSGIIVAVRAYFKGYVVNNCSGVYEGPEDYMIETKEADQVTTRNKRFFKAIMNLCEREGVEVVLYSVPAPVNYNTYKHNGIQMLADEYGLKYIDFNMNWKEIGIDWSKDSQDCGDHLNRDGGIKLSTWLGN